MRYLFYYLLSEVGIRFKKYFAGTPGHNDITSQLYYFKWDVFCTVQEKNLQDFIKAAENNPKQNFLLLFGKSSWEIAKHSHTVSFECSILFKRNDLYINIVIDELTPAYWIYISHAIIAAQIYLN